MNNLMTITLLLITFTSCGKKLPEEDYTFKCDTNTKNLLSDIKIGDDINRYNYTSNLFHSVEPTIYETSSFYNANYNFKQYNTDTIEWCYYYSIDTNINGIITSIFSN